ncbi:MAG: DeoR family transcriptional regulator [Parcubacteria group bacterium]|nr:DeoR family transcriptional regulator [Parcubacteria group bacterium]
MIKKKPSLEDRQKWILEKVVQSYIQKGEPIASQFLVVHCNFNVSPATIRNDFQELAEEGYLYKFHISSGRVPTDKAWKYFVQSMLAEDNIVEQWRNRWVKLLRQKIKTLADWNQILNFIAEESRALSFCYLPEQNEVKKAGLKYIFYDLVEEPDVIPQIAESLDRLDEALKKMRFERDPLILIGRDNPLIKDDGFSALLAKSRRSHNIFGILGSKRMPYDKNIGLLDALKELV